MTEFRENALGWFERTVELPSWPGGPRLIKIHLDRNANKDGSATGHDLACEYLLDHDARITNSLLRALLGEYPRIRDEVMSEELPEVRNQEELLSLIALESVCVGFLETEVPYFGFAFECAWDPEHGLGVMMHGERVIEVSFDNTMAYDPGVPNRDQLIGNLWRLLERSVQPGEYVLSRRSSLWRYNEPHEPDLTVLGKAGRPALVVDIRGFYNDPRRDYEGLRVYRAFPDVTAVLWLCPGPPMAVLWSRNARKMNRPGDTRTSCKQAAIASWFQSVCDFGFLISTTASARRRECRECQRAEMRRGKGP